MVGIDLPPMDVAIAADYADKLLISAREDSNFEPSDARLTLVVPEIICR